jgi:hypothetical protein
MDKQARTRTHARRHRAIINYWVKINYCTFETVTDTSMRQIENYKELIKFSLATSILTYHLRLESESLSMENGVSCARGLHRRSRTHSLPPQVPRTLLHATYTYKDI